MLAPLAIEDGVIQIANTILTLPSPKERVQSPSPSEKDLG
jgi:hypothetical protein